MNTLFGKQVYLRLSEHGTSFLYTVTYGRFAKITREVQLIHKIDAPAIPEMSDAPIPCRVPLPQRGCSGSARKGGPALHSENLIAQNRKETDL